MLNRAVIVFVLLTTSSGVIAWAAKSEQIPPRQPFDAFPMSIDEWNGRAERPLSEKELAILGADDYLTRTYFAPGRAANLYIGFWESQKRGDAVHSPLNCLPGSGWQPLSHRSLRFTVPDVTGAKSEIQVNRYVIQKGLNRELVLYWYQSHGRVIDSEYWGKFYLVADAMRLGRSDTSIVRVITSVTDASPAAEASAERMAIEFVEQLFPRLEEFIPS